jgi:hypothetical protein
MSALERCLYYRNICIEEMSELERCLCTDETGGVGWGTDQCKECNKHLGTEHAAWFVPKSDACVVPIL